MFKELEEFKKTSQTLQEAAKADTNRPVLSQTLLFILSYIAMTLILALVTTVLITGVDVNSDNYVLLSMAAFIVTIIISLFAITKLEKRNLRSVGFSRDNILSSLLKGLILGFGMFILIVLIGMLLGQYHYDGFDLSSLYLAIPYIIVFIIQPFAEEIYTRGWIIPLFSKNYSVFIAILVSSLFFISGHVGNNGFNIVALINILLMSIFLALLFLKCDNIWICGAFHSAWNFCQSYLLGFHVSGFNTSSLLQFSQSLPSTINGGEFGPEAGLIATFVILLALIFIWKVDLN